VLIRVCKPSYVVQSLLRMLTTKKAPKKGRVVYNVDNRSQLVVASESHLGRLYRPQSSHLRPRRCRL